LALFPNQEAHFHLDHPDAGQDAGAHVVLWGGVEVLYADVYERRLFRTRIFIREYRNPQAKSDWVLQVGIARNVYERKSLVKAAKRMPARKLEDPRDAWPLSALWIAGEDPDNGTVIGHP
jgi:hypothetical protein